MSDTTVTCSKCRERVPKKKFCFECGAPLASSVNQPTTSQEDKGSTPVIDSASLEAGIANGQSTDVVNKQPTSSFATTSCSPNEKTNGTPSSYAEAASVGTRPLDEGHGQSNQTGRPVPNNGSTDAPGNAGSVTVTELSNDVTTATNVADGANKADEKVNVSVNAMN